MEAATDPQLTHIELYPLLASITAATDLISRVLVDHHHKVAFLAATLGQALGWDEQSRRRATLAGAVHDIGGLSLKTRLESFEFEVINPDRHTLPGSSLLAGFAPFADLARIIRFHHVPWLAGRGVEERGEEVPLLSHLIHLADRVAVQLTPEREILSQKGEIIEVITAGAGERFVPEFVEAFREVASREAFWLDLISPTVGAILQERLPLGGMDLGRGDLMALAEMLRRVIDFRSRFTATHSSGVAAVACALAERAGFEQQRPDRVRMAGLLHDIGKLVVPAEILEKHHALDQDDFAVIFKHPYYSRAILRGIEGFAEISVWGGAAPRTAGRQRLPLPQEGGGDTGRGAHPRRCRHLYRLDGGSPLPLRHQRRRHGADHAGYGGIFQARPGPRGPDSGALLGDQRPALRGPDGGRSQPPPVSGREPVARRPHGNR